MILGFPLSKKTVSGKSTSHPLTESTLSAGGIKCSMNHKNDFEKPPYCLNLSLWSNILRHVVSFSGSCFRPLCYTPCTRPYLHTSHLQVNSPSAFMMSNLFSSASIKVRSPYSYASLSASVKFLVSFL